MMIGYWVFVLLMASAFAINNSVGPAEKNCTCVLLMDYDYIAVGIEGTKVNATLNTVKDTVSQNYFNVVVYVKTVDQYVIRATLEQSWGKILVQHHTMTNFVLFYISLSALIYLTIVLLKRVVSGYGNLQSLTFRTNLNMARAIHAELVAKHLNNCKEKYDSNHISPQTCNDRKQKQKHDIPICHTRKYLIRLLDEERGEIELKD